MHRFRTLPVHSCSRVIPALHSLRNVSRFKLECALKLRQSSCAAYSSSNTWHCKAAQSSGGGGGAVIPPYHLLSPQIMSAQGHFTTQHRNYSSFTDLCKQLMTVSAADGVGEAVSAADGVGEVTSAAAGAADVTSGTAAAAALTPDSAATLTDGIEYIPLPPVPFAGGVDPSTLTALGEPSLASLGLAGYSPVGLVQMALESIHVYLDLPWYGSIALATIILRLLLFPVVIIAQRNAAKLANVSPQMQVLQLKMTEARQAGDQLQVARYTNELVLFMKEKNVNPIKSMLVPLAQAPVFISMFVGLRRCATLPVMSMATGGALWFTDLTVADPYYLLPVMTSITMYLTIQLGTEVGRMQAAGETARIMFTVMRFMPIIFFPFMINFPAAVLCYWFTTNIMSLSQAMILKVPVIRDFFNIPVLVKHNPDNLPMTKEQNKKSTVQAAKDAWKNFQVTRQLQDRQRYDEVRFAKAGTAPIVRTYKYDPTITSKTKAKRNSIISTKATIKQ